uniref:(northern house mosquito) hypothetical protein n=1 Tax=Culex pipiens TaxID=7175 RepID=A0A8D8DM72_CULPI
MIDSCTCLAVPQTQPSQTTFTATIWTRRFGPRSFPLRNRKSQVAASSTQPLSSVMPCTSSVGRSTTMCAAETCTGSSSQAIRNARFRMTLASSSKIDSFATFSLSSERTRRRFPPTSP